VLRTGVRVHPGAGWRRLSQARGRRPSLHLPRGAACHLARDRDPVGDGRRQPQKPTRGASSRAQASGGLQRRHQRGRAGAVRLFDLQCEETLKALTAVPQSCVLPSLRREDMRTRSRSRGVWCSWLGPCHGVQATKCLPRLYPPVVAVNLGLEGGAAIAQLAPPGRLGSSGVPPRSPSPRPFPASLGGGPG